MNDMHWDQLLVILGAITAITTIVAVAFANSKNKYFDTQRVNYESTIKSYQEVIDGYKAKHEYYENEIKDLRDLHAESMQQIGELKGELKSYRELPLKEIAENQRVITTVQLLIAEHMQIDGIGELMSKLNKNK